MVRLTRFHAVSFRSLADVQLDDLPDIVLFYGENDVGKSNILRAVGAWLKLSAHVLNMGSDLQVDATTGTMPAFLLAHRTAGDLFGRPVHSQFRHEHVTMELGAKLRIPAPASPNLELGLDFKVTLLEDDDDDQRPMDERPRVSVTVLRVDWPGIGRLKEAIPASDPALIALRGALADPWLWISSERRFHSEGTGEIQAQMGAALETDDGGDQTPAPNGRGLLRSLFRAHVGTDRALRRAFDKRFVRMLANGPFPLDAPRPVLDEEGWLDLWVGDRSIREHGSGPRQWALIAGMMAMSSAGIVGLEEPEANLSWEARLAIARRLVAAVRNPQAAPYQMFITSHDGSMYEASAGEVWFEVTIADGATQVTPRRGEKGLGALVPVSLTPPPPPKGSMRLYPGGVLVLPDRVVKHLGAEVGSFLYPLFEHSGEIRLVEEGRFEELAIPENDEHGEGGAK